MKQILCFVTFFGKIPHFRAFSFISKGKLGNHAHSKLKTNTQGI